MARISLAALLLLAAHAGALNVVVFMPGTTENERAGLAKIAQHLAFKNYGTATFKAVIVPEVRYLVKQKLHLVREISLGGGLHSNLSDPVKHIGNKAPWTAHYDTVDYIKPLWQAYANVCEAVLNSDLMDRLKIDSYDVALVYADQPCHLAIVYAMQLPYIIYDLWGFTDEIVVASGSPILPDLMPSSETTFGMEMTWREKLANAWSWFQAYVPHTNSTWLIDRFGPLKARMLDQHVTKLFRTDYELKKRFKYFPSVAEMQQQAALYFVNSDPVLEFPGRTVMPNVIYVGGAHMEYPRPLFESWNYTVSQNDIIVVSFGNVATTRTMPLKFRNALFEAFRRLPQFRFYVKQTGQSAEDAFPDLNETDIPPNVNCTFFIPQLDVLASRSAKLLITNGGIQSIIEAMHYAVPILGIPLVGPNYNNLRKVEKRGFGMILDKRELTADKLYEAIKALTKEGNRYTITAREISQVVNDRPMTPFETAIFWIEYVGRNHGAPFMSKSGMRVLSIYQYLLVDAVMVMCIALVVGAWITLKLSSVCYRKLFGKQVAALTPKEKANGHVRRASEDAKKNDDVIKHNGDTTHETAAGKMKKRGANKAE